MGQSAASSRFCRRVCGGAVCMHYVTTTSDAPPLAASDGVTPDWVRRNLEVTEFALTRMAELGYPVVPSDSGRGETAQFDVYLADTIGEVVVGEPRGLGHGPEGEALVRADEEDRLVDTARAGLAIAKHIVQAHGGEITAQSEGAGRGSTFAFTLPRA